MKFRNPFAKSERRDNPLENPAVPLGSAINSVLGWLMGGSTTKSGEVISEYTALQHSAVYACVKVLAESIGSLTCRTYKRLPKGRSEAVDDPVHRMLSLKPNDEQSAANLWECAVACMALAGNAYLEILRNKVGQPVQIYPLHPLQTKPIRLPDGKLAYKTWSGMQQGQERIIASADMLHFRLFSWDGIIGLSPIQQCKEAIGLGKASTKASAKFFGNGSKSSGTLTWDGEGAPAETDMTNLKRFVEAGTAGDNWARIVPIPGRWKFTPLTISARDSQFLETMGFTRSEIAAIFGVPPHKIGDSSRLTNASAEQQNLSFVLDTLRPYLVKLEQEIAIKLFPVSGDSRFVEFDTSERIRGDFKSMMDGFAVGKQWGFYTTNMVLEKLGENPIGPEGDIFWSPVNMQNAARLLDTESVQDQPIGATEDPAPQIRSTFDRYGTAFLSLYKDAVGRVTTRSKRDAEAIAPILTPVLSSIAEVITAEARNQFNLSDTWTGSDKAIRDVLKGIASRAAEWKPEQRDDIAGVELPKAIRSLYYGIYREAGAAIAEKGLNDEKHTA